MSCQKDGKSGFKAGPTGFCFTGSGAEGKAKKQLAAIKISQTRNDDQKRNIRSLREIKRATGGKLPTITKQPPLPGSTKMLEMDYFITIKELLTPYYRDINERLIPKIPDIVQRFKEQTKVDDVYGTIITKRIKDISIGIALDMPEFLLKRKTGTMATRIAQFNKGSVDRQVRTVLGVNPISNESFLQPQIESFVERNAALIKDIPEASLKRIEIKLRTGVERGLSSKKLADMVQDELKISKNRAKLIARDQTSKFMGKLTELRQTELGVEEYVWSTAGDERVRPSHASKNGKVFKWDKPPADTGHPGQDVHCRCRALPVFDDLKAGTNIQTRSVAGKLLVGTAIAAKAIRKLFAPKEIKT